MKAEVIRALGDDLLVVNAARVSFDKESSYETVPCGCPGGMYNPEYCDGSCVLWDPKLSERDTKLIHYLADHGHFTPFTHCQIVMRETVPIFVARQRFKHTVGFSYSEVSRRYVDSAPEFFTPDAWRMRAENKKQGSSDKTTGTWGFGLYEKFLEHAKSIYNDMLEYGVCPEQARMVLPQSMYTSYYVTGSLAAFARAYKLRSDEHAQKEIRDLAESWDRLIRPLFPVSWEALTHD